MFETSKILLLEITRNLRRKMRVSPILYLFFSAMVFFSLVMFAFLTFFLLHTETTFNFMDVFFTVFFLFLMKSASDMHTHFISAPQVSYALSADVSSRRTVAGIIVGIVLMNMGLWFSFSLVYLVVLSGLRIQLFYPIEYLLFSMSILGGILLGCSLSLHFFSSKQFRLIPSILLLVFCWFSQNMLFVAGMLPLALLHCLWAVSHPLDSYRFVRRKQRTSTESPQKTRGVLHTLFLREVTGIWRDRLYISFVSMSVFTALGTGYLFLYGTDLFIPESIQRYLPVVMSLMIWSRLMSPCFSLCSCRNRMASMILMNSSRRAG